MILAIEDIISEVAVRKILSLINPYINGTEITVVGNRGNSYLKQKASELNRTAHAVPVLLVTDQDRPQNCPINIRSLWVGPSINTKLTFRVAVYEIESWLLADREAFASFVNVPLSKIPVATDTISQPKEFIVKLARSSRSSKIREEIVPTQGSTAIVGPAYNPCMVQFITDKWDPTRASNSSHSLNKALVRIKQIRL